MAYAPLGPRGPFLAAADTTGSNAGNWTTAVTSDLLGIHVPVFECYHMVVDQVPAGASARITIGVKPWGFTSPDAGSEWDPNQPMLLTPGQDIYFYWSAAASGTPPRVTLWFRYDAAMWGGS